MAFVTTVAAVLSQSRPTTSNVSPVICSTASSNLPPSEYRRSFIQPSFSCNETMNGRKEFFSGRSFVSPARHVEASKLQPTAKCMLDSEGGVFQPSVTDAGNQISTVIEGSFRKAMFFAIAAGPNPRYFAAMKSFIEAGIAAFLHGFSLMALKLELSSKEPASGDAMVDEFVRLDGDEAAIRNDLLKVLYLTLLKIGYRPQDESDWTQPRVVDDQGVDYIVSDVVKGYRAGKTLDAILEEEKLLYLPGESSLSRMRRLLRTQWVHTVYVTLDVLHSR